MHDAHAMLLDELQRARAMLRVRQAALDGSPREADSLAWDQLREEVNELAESCMTLAADLWRLIREERAVASRLRGSDA